MMATLETVESAVLAITGQTTQELATERRQLVAARTRAGLGDSSQAHYAELAVSGWLNRFGIRYRSGELGVRYMKVVDALKLIATSPEKGGGDSWGPKIPGGLTAILERS
jgi:hypothetical protein